MIYHACTSTCQHQSVHQIWVTYSLCCSEIRRYNYAPNSKRWSCNSDDANLEIMYIVSKLIPDMAYTWSKFEGSSFSPFEIPGMKEVSKLEIGGDYGRRMSLQFHHSIEHVRRLIDSCLIKKTAPSTCTAASELYVGVELEGRLIDLFSYVVLCSVM